MNTLEQVDLLRIRASSDLDPKTKSSLGQFFTASPICLYMVSLFNKINNDVNLLDPGCGPGSLTASFVEEALKRKSVHTINIDAFDIEKKIKPYINETLELCVDRASK
ncbi:MAG: N-6 DNA methylase, partial [Nitrosopumilus sp.]